MTIETADETDRVVDRILDSWILEQPEGSGRGESKSMSAAYNVIDNGLRITIDYGVPRGESIISAIAGVTDPSRGVDPKLEHWDM
eukprot:6322690-Pyramimonas_sp.AAC.1